MILCLGNYIRTLMRYVVPGATNQQKIFKDLIETIDSENLYEENKHKPIISNIVNCKVNLPTQGKLTSIISEAKNIETSELKKKFVTIVNNFQEDHKANLVCALQLLIGSDETLKYIHDDKSKLFLKYMGDLPEEVSKAQAVDLKAFLAGLFLFVVMTNDNIQTQESLDDIALPDNKISLVELEGNKTIATIAQLKYPEPPEPTPSILPGQDDGEAIHPPHPHARIRLDRYKDEDWLETYPSDLYIISLYFITLMYGEKHYLLLDYGSYLHHNGSWIDGHIWSVPYTNAKINLGDRKVSKMKEIRAVYEDALKQTNEKAYREGHISMRETLNILEADMFYQLGIAYKNLQHDDKNDYIEYKVSASEPDKSRCYYIREFFVKDIDDAGIINLADPRCLHGHYYLPLSLADSLPKISSQTHEVQWTQGAYQFMGKAIPENVSEVLANKRILLRESSVTVKKSAMLHKETGVLFKIAVADSDGIFETSIDKGRIDQQISTALELGMMYANVRHYMLDNYQVTGVMPSSEPDKPTDFKVLLENLHSRLVEIVRNLRDPGIYGLFKKKILIRCTALHCEYEYGKIVDITSQRPGFAGNSLGTLRCMARETHRVQLGMRKEIHGILFGIDIKDRNLITLSSLGAKKYSEYGMEPGSTMEFLLLDNSD